MAAAFKVHVRLRCLFARMILLLGSPARAASTDVVLNEILYNADSSNGGGEFVELHNRGAAPVELSGWTLGGGVSFTFPQGVSLPAKGYLVICRNEAQARA